MYLYKIVSESSLFKNFSGHVNSTQTIYDSTSQLPWIIIQLFVGFSMFFHKLGSMSLFGIVILFLWFCPVVYAAATEDPFPNIAFDVFSAFIESTFGPKISLSTVLMLLFSLNKNTDLLNLHARSQNPQFHNEQKRDSSTWMNVLSKGIQKKLTAKKMK